MSDMMNPLGAPASPETPSDKKRGFLSTTLGKLVIGGAVLLVLVAVLGAIAYFFLFNTATDMIETATTGAVSKGSKNASGSAEATVIVEPPKTPISSTFAFRNVFAPTVKPKVSTDTSGTGSNTDGSTDAQANTLYLTAITDVDGVKQATFLWNGTEYTVGEGEQVDSSPWQVVSIGTDSVVMLYGDNQITITLGQGITK